MMNCFCGTVTFLCSIYIQGNSPRLSQQKCATSCLVDNDVEIIMGRAISSIHFVLVVEFILKTASAGARPAKLGQRHINPLL